MTSIKKYKRFTDATADNRVLEACTKRLRPSQTLTTLVVHCRQIRELKNKKMS